MRKSIAFVAALAIIVTGGAAQATASPDREQGVQQIAPGPLPQETFGALVDVYAAVESMPEHFEAMGDEDGAAQWLHAEFEGRGWLGGCPECATTVRADVEKCLIGTADFIVANLTPARWILMLWKVIKQHGSSLTIVGALNEALTRSHQQQRDALETVLEVFGVLGATVSNVLSLDGIFKNCF